MLLWKCVCPVFRNIVISDVLVMYFMNYQLFRETIYAGIFYLIHPHSLSRSCTLWAGTPLDSRQKMQPLNATKCPTSGPTATYPRWRNSCSTLAANSTGSANWPPATLNTTDGHNISSSSCSEKGWRIRKRFVSIVRERKRKVQFRRLVLPYPASLILLNIDDYHWKLWLNISERILGSLYYSISPIVYVD